MTADAPGGWELQRAMEQQRTDLREGLAQINGRLDRLVSTDAFAAEQRRVDEKLKDLADDITAEKAARVQAVEDEKTARKAGDANLQTTLDKMTTTIRWVATSLALPVALFAANIYVQTRGGVG